MGYPDFSQYHWGSGYTTDGNTITVASGGTLNDTWFGLYGDTVVLGSSAVPFGGAETLNTYGYSPIGAIDVSLYASPTINVNGYAVVGSINVSPIATGVNINLAPGSALNTHFTGSGYLDTINVNGGADTWLMNTGDSTVTRAVINADVFGTGSWSLLAHPPGGGSIAFAQYVSPDQTINANFNATVQIDQPHAFQGLIDMSNLGNYGQILLAGIQGDSFSYQNDILSVYDNGYLMDNLRLHAINGAAFSVENTSKGVALVASLSPQASSGIIPHVITTT